MIIILNVFMGVFFILYGEVIQSMIFVKPMVFDTIDNFLRVNMIILINDLNDVILNYKIFTTEIYKVRSVGFISKRELTIFQIY